MLSIPSLKYPTHSVRNDEIARTQSIETRFNLFREIFRIWTKTLHFILSIQHISILKIFEIIIKRNNDFSFSKSFAFHHFLIMDHIFSFQENVCFAKRNFRSSLPLHTNSTQCTNVVYLANKHIVLPHEKKNEKKKNLKKI